MEMNVLAENETSVIAMPALKGPEFYDAINRKTINANIKLIFEASSNCQTDLALVLIFVKDKLLTLTLNVHITLPINHIHINLQF